jgi:signal transduction histidine kinase
LLRIHLITLITVVSLVVISNLIYFSLQQINEKNALASLLNQHALLQNQTSKSIANGISSDLDSMFKMIENVAQIQALKETLIANMAGKNSQNQDNTLMLGFLNDQINSTYRDLSLKADRMYIINKSGIIVNSFAPKGENLFLGLNLSFRDYVKDTVQSKMPVFSGVFEGADGKIRLAITYPILNNTNALLHSDTGSDQTSPTENITNSKNQYLGLVAASAPVSQIFERYGNIYNIKSQYLVGYDRNGTIMVSPRTEYIGKNFDDPQVQSVTNSNGVFNRIIHNLLNGSQDQGLYTTDLGERYNTAFPIIVDGRPVYGLTVVTPTNSIYENINVILQNERVQGLLIFSTMSAGVMIVILNLRNWSKDMEREVKKRTSELDEANQTLGVINEKMTAAEKAKEEFISMVSHELRTPLMPIKAYASMLLNPKYTGGINEKQRKAIESILRNVTIMERLVGDVLDVYRLEMNRLKLAKESVNISSLIDNATSEFNEIIKTQDSEKNIELVSEIKVDKDIKLKCDPQRINQVLGNLIKNSIDFVPANKGKIIVSAKLLTDDPNFTSNLGPKEPEQKPFVLFTVQDNGPGIPSDKIDHMFKKFYQIDTSLTRKHGGTGLGLAICKGIVESHGGTIWIDKSYTVGTSISFTLPAG